MALALFPIFCYLNWVGKASQVVMWAVCLDWSCTWPGLSFRSSKYPSEYEYLNSMDILKCETKSKGWIQFLCETIIAWRQFPTWLGLLRGQEVTLRQLGSSFSASWSLFWHPLQICCLGRVLIEENDREHSSWFPRHRWGLKGHCSPRACTLPSEYRASGLFLGKTQNDVPSSIGLRHIQSLHMGPEQHLWRLQPLIEPAELEFPGTDRSEYLRSKPHWNFHASSEEGPPLSLTTRW